MTFSKNIKIFISDKEITIAAKETKKELEKDLFGKSEGNFTKLSKTDIQKAQKYCEGYKKYLDSAKTERELALYSTGLAEEHGFVPYKYGMKVKAGDKFYISNRNKALVLFTVGSLPIDEGIHIAVAHIDSPRLDIKPHPVLEKSEIGYFKTHYYGGIRKYQWPTIPLALHGTVVLKDGSSEEISIGEKEDDPVFCISDLLPHLSAEQNTKELSKAYSAEDFNIIVGTEPYAEKADQNLQSVPDNSIRLNILKILNENFGITEDDFVSAELCAVPAYKAKDIGLDRSLIGAYAHDDRVCAYPELTAMFECKKPKHTAMIILTDKEEIGSEGNTSMQSSFLSDIIDDLSETLGARAHNVRLHSKCISADVNAAYDPNYTYVFDANNSARLNHGACITKYTGAAGKVAANDASAEYTAYIRKLFNDNKVLWHIAEFGKVDGGSAGTVAKFVARLNIDTIDVGVPVLSMHAPFEIVAKTDVYAMHLALKAFLCD